MTVQSQPLKIVCFGDSLTLGYQSPSPGSPFVESIPYGTELQEWLGGEGQVLVRGVCGETTQDMRLRFQEDVLAPSPKVVIILGGTNDLGLGISPAGIMENLKFFYQHAQNQEILPVAITVPSLRENPGQNDESDEFPTRISPVVEQAIALRVRLNQSIKELGRKWQFPVLDLFAETCESQTLALAREYSNDGLHLNTAGYLKLAELVWYQVLEDLLNKPKIKDLAES